MNKNTNVAEEEMSLSKQRKIQRKLDIEKAKRNRKIGKIVGWIVAALVAVAACLVIFLVVRRLVTSVTPSKEFSSGLASNGYIEGVTAKDIVTLPKYKGIEIEYKSIALSDTDLEKKIDAIKTEHAAQSTTTDKAVAKDDVIVVEYKSYFEDGTEVEKGATDKDGLTLTVGSSSLKDYGFDTALVGKKIADKTFDVMVEFPATYTANKAVAGKKIKYVTSIKSIKITPEFDDAFVEKNLSKYAKTADEYRTYLREKTERETLENLIAKQVVSGASVSKYPKYLKQVKSIIKYNDIATYNYYVQMYGQYISYFPNLKSFEAYVDMSMAKYDRSLDSVGKDQLKIMLTYQAIAEIENITSDLASYRAYYINELEGEGETFDKNADTYGHNYMVQLFLQTKVIDYLADNAVITGKDK